MEAYSGSYPASKSHPLLHSVRKSQAKPWKKSPVAPPAPTPIRVYKVDAINFRDLVQHLTGAPEFKPQQFFQTCQTETLQQHPQQGVQSETLGMKSQATAGGANSLLEFNLSSPSSYNWCISQ